MGGDETKYRMDVRRTPVHLSNVSCNGDEAHLAACSHSMFGGNDCKHDQDVRVACSVPNVRGKLEYTIQGVSQKEGYHNFRLNYKRGCNVN